MQYQHSLNSIIDAVKIISPDSFSFAGKTFKANERYHESNIAKPIDPLVKLLTDILYEQCYCRKFTGSYYESLPVTEDNVTFQTSLSEANSTMERWDKDWIIEQVLPTGQYIAGKYTKYKLLYPGEFITSEYQSALPQQGTKIMIHCPKESLGSQAAFYFVYGTEIIDQQGLITMVRFYWNIKSTAASKLIELLTKNLNKYYIPFVFKCLNNPGMFTRSDAAVLYVSKPYYTITAQILASIYSEIKSELNVEVPGFTKELNPGLGLAEDPGTGESFGISRCGIIAQGIFTAYESGLNTNENIMYQIQKVFDEKGIQLATLHLNAGSKDIYEFNN